MLCLAYCLLVLMLNVVSSILLACVDVKWFCLAHCLLVLMLIVVSSTLACVDVK